MLTFSGRFQHLTDAEWKKKEMFSLFSDHNETFLMQQPGALIDTVLTPCFTLVQYADSRSA